MAHMNLVFRFAGYGPKLRGYGDRQEAKAPEAVESLQNRILLAHVCLKFYFATAGASFGEF
jgi:hypothetical protein